MKTKDILTKEQVKKLSDAFYNYYYEHLGLKKVRGRHYLVFLFLRDTGARISEIINIDDEKDLDLENNRITVTTAKTFTKRTLTITDEDKKAYLEYIGKFPDMKGKAFKVNRINFFERYRNVAMKSGITKELSHPDLLRKTKIVELLRQGKSIKEVQKIAGIVKVEDMMLYVALLEKIA
jgi:molybdate transport system regulatory protein